MERPACQRVLLASCGESLLDFPKRRFASDRVVAVNRAALNPAAAACGIDYWCFLDPKMYAKCWRAVSRGCRLVTTRATYHAVVRPRETPQEACRLVDFTLEPDMPPADLNYGRFSATMALAFAASLLPAHGGAVHCWGVDMRGQADWDGTVWAEYRRDNDPTRWQDERHIWQRLEDALEIRRVQVIRHQLAAALESTNEGQ